MYEESLEKLREVASPILKNLGYRLVDAEFTSEHGRFTLRLYIDKEDGRITIDDCELASRSVEHVIEAEGIFSTGYDLEVSSPGLDRPLKTKQDFEKFKGNVIQLRTREPLDGRSNYKGILEDIVDNQIHVVVDNMKFQIPIGLVSKARLVPEIGQKKKNN